MAVRSEKIKLYYPTETTTKRLLEIHFYMFMSAFLGTYNRANPQVDELLSDLYRLFGVREATMNIVTSQLNHAGFKPTNMEKSVAVFYLNTLSKKAPNLVTLQSMIGIGNGTYYSNLKSYIDQNQPDLKPILSDHQLEEILKFMKKAKKMFTLVSHSVQGVEIYDEY